MKTNQNDNGNLKRIKTPCPIGYLNPEGRLFFHHYLDPSIACWVWGIGHSGMVYAKCHKANGCYEDALHLLKTERAPKVYQLQLP